MELLFKQVVGLVNYYSLVNCYALGLTGQFRIDFSYIDRVRHNSARMSSFSKFSIFRKFVFVFVSGFIAFTFVFVFKCKSRKGLRGFPTVFIPNHTCRAKHWWKFENDIPVRRCLNSNLGMLRIRLASQCWPSQRLHYCLPKMKNPRRISLSEVSSDFALWGHRTAHVFNSSFVQRHFDRNVDE